MTTLPVPVSAALVAWSGVDGRTRVDDQAAAIERLPSPGEDPFVRLARAFLAGYPENSALGYRVDLEAWQAWCQRAGRASV